MEVHLDGGEYKWVQVSMNNDKTRELQTKSERS